MKCTQPALEATIGAAAPRTEPGSRRGLIVNLSPQLRRLLRVLQATGNYGESEADAAGRLIAERIAAVNAAIGVGVPRAVLV